MLTPLHDPLSLPGARALAIRIREYWRAKGFHLETRIEEIKGAMYSQSIFCVRSNFGEGKNGWPPRAKVTGL